MLKHRKARVFVAVGAIAAVWPLLSTTALAGGFAVREQSAYGLGSAYAGIAAGGALSSMFWNPATMTQFAGMQSESVLTGLLPSSTNTVGPGSTLSALGFGGTGNVAHDALVPAGYFSWQIAPQLWIGMSTNSPYGLTETFPDVWAGRDYAAGGSHLLTYNATPSIAYKISDWISVGAGVQIQYADATLTKGIGATPGLQASIDGAGWGVGFTAGVTLTPMAGTSIGVGYRSGINQKINGTLILPGGVPFNPPFSTPGSVSTTINLPDTVSVGLRQKIGAQWTVMGTVEWSHWSRIGTSAVTQPSGAPAVVLAGLGGGAVTVPFEYRDGWFFSGGVEYQWSQNFAVRGGLGFERSPITDQVRIPAVPDNDRTWVAIGATYNVTPQLSLDAAYSHLFVKDTPINVVAGNPSFNGAVSYVGTVDSRIDIISIGMRYRWDAPAAAAVKTRG